jgi:U3 small nucleolar RNA-associated protein 24
MGKHQLRAAKIRQIKKTDPRLSANQPHDDKPTHAEIAPVTEADAFFAVNASLGPPYHVLLDTSFLNNSVRYRIDIIQGLITCLCAKVTPYITDCVMSELEKNHDRFSIALRLAKDPRIKRIHCDHANLGYADDCLVQKVSECKCYMVATNDRELRSRIRKIPGIPIVYAKRTQQYGVERLPETEVI